MSAWRKMVAAVVAFSAIAFLLANLALRDDEAVENGRPYRVEINRLAREIGEKGPEGVDLSRCEYVYNVESLEEAAVWSDSDHAVREIGGKLYRFDYVSKSDVKSSRRILLVNVGLACVTAFVLGTLLYVRAKILRPFQRLVNVPYELSRGNLTAPVQESKGKFFGKFLWGMDLLRENIEQQKQRELELQKEKKTLLLSLSHDIKTPLSAIKIYAAALERNLYPEAEKQREVAGSIGAKADEIEGYVSKIIAASREDFLSLAVEDGEFYLSDLIEDVAAYYTEKLALLKTDFIVGKYRDCLLSGDLDRSVEVLQNVMENAVKYGDGRRVELLFPEDDEGVCVAVRNSGCTLDKFDLPHVFESFWRGANSENVPGSGLGLYICRQLMHKMDGEIFAEIVGGVMTVTAVFGRA